MSAEDQQIDRVDDICYVGLNDGFFSDFPRWSQMMVWNSMV